MTKAVVLGATRTCWPNAFRLLLRLLLLPSCSLAAPPTRVPSGSVLLSKRICSSNWIFPGHRAPQALGHFAFSCRQCCRRTRPAECNLQFRARHWVAISPADGSTTDTSSVERWNLFFSWAKRSGISWRNWEVGEDSDGLRGALATDHIAQGDVLIRVPFQRALVARDDGQCPLPPSFVTADFWEQTRDSWELRVALVLLHEKSLGEQSQFQPYLDILPRSFGLPLSYTCQEVSALRHPRLERDIKREQRWLAEQFEVLRLAMDSPPSWDEFVWAMSCAYSRTFKCTFHGTQAPAHVMCPMLDMVNHDPQSSPAFSWTRMDSPCNSSEHSARESASNAGQTDSSSERRLEIGRVSGGGDGAGWFQLTASQNTARGEQVCISYGPFGNRHLLQRYGFVLDNNKHDFVAVSESELWDAAVQCYVNLCCAPTSDDDERGARVSSWQELEERLPGFAPHHKTRVLQHLMAPPSTSSPAPLRHLRASSPLHQDTLLRQDEACHQPSDARGQTEWARQLECALPWRSVWRSEATEAPGSSSEGAAQGFTFEIKHDSDLTALRVYVRTLAATLEELGAPCAEAAVASAGSVSDWDMLDPGEMDEDWKTKFAFKVQDGAPLSAENSANARAVLTTALTRQLAQTQSGGHERVDERGIPHLQTILQYRELEAQLLASAIRSVEMGFVV